MSAWLSFTITPVQGFVEAARTVRDLRVGSDILCLLAHAAYQAATAIGAPRPVLPASPDRAHMPNTFLLEYDAETDAKTAGDQAVEAAEDAWTGLAADVKGLIGITDSGWELQIKSYFDIRSLVIPLGGCKDAAERHKRAALALGSTKLIRHTPADQGSGRSKCTIMGEWEQIGHPAPYSRDRLHVREGERLCAVALVKRFAPLARCADPGLKDLAGEVPDTGGVATQAWAASATASAEWEAYRTAAKGLGEPPISRLLLEGRDQIIEDLGKARSTEVDAVCAARRALTDAVRNELGPPPRYYAILCLDGDDMGKWLRREKSTYIREEGFEVWVSEELLCYCCKVRCIVDGHNAYLVYAGGDDVLALTPLATMPQLALDLREAYPDFSGEHEAGPSTASIGVAVVHYKSNLQEGLQTARRMLRRAKDDGRDRIGLAVHKRSGGATECTASWEALRAMEVVRGFYQGPQPMSDRWLGRFGELAGTLSAAASAAPVRNQVTYFAARAEGAEDRKALFPDAVGALWDSVAASVKKAVDERGSGDPPRERIETLLALAGLASFLDRGVDLHG
jgi:CRISPR-associated protein Cmr2